ncbi:MAG: ABC transporter substrate-binding protein [Acidimicrobiales bacterium]
MTDRSTTARRRRAVGPVAGAVLATVALLGAACSSSSTSSGSGDTPGTVEAGTDVTLAADGPPRAGGSLTFGMSGETDGYNPTQNRWAGDGTTVGLTLFDPLAAYAADGSAVPYLAESFTPHDDFTQWTIQLRDGVTFHDGTPLRAEAVKRTMDGLRASPLTGPALAPIESVKVTDDLTLVVTAFEPWAAYPVNLTGQAGVVAAPSQLDDPDGARAPVGTGPFRFVSWENDKELVVERNPDYWRTDTDGNALPYLDQIVFRPIPEDSQRVAGLQTGEIDMTWSATASTVRQLRDLAAAGEIQLVEQEGQTEVAFVMLNLGAPPFDDPRARLALAQATDADSYASVLAEGITNPARTLFRPGTRFHSDVEIPGYDPDAARATLAEYEADKGPLAFTLKVQSTPGGRAQGEFLQQLWQQVGMEVTVEQAEATAFLGETVVGDFEAVTWGQFGSPDPDYEQVWWRSSSSKPVGELSLNFPRHADPATDDALDRARATDDLDARIAAYADVQRRFAEDLPYIYLDFTQPAIAAGNDVRGITNGPLPDGSPAYPMGGPGSFSYVTFLTQTWLVDG